MATTNETVWFITGANRGIGLELTKQLLQSPSNTVIAACRSPSKADALQALSEKANGKLHIVPLTVTDKASIDACAKEVASLVGDKGVDYLVNNAGVNLNHSDTATTVDTDVMQQTFLTNVVGPAYIAQAFLPLVEKSTKKTIVNVSSTLGSIASDFGAIATSYAISKAALNMLTYKQAKAKPEITVVSMCPGWLRTDLGGPNADYPVSVGVEGVLKVVTGLKHADSGSFFNFKGERVPW